MHILVWKKFFRNIAL